MIDTNSRKHNTKTIQLMNLVSHPIQYPVPLLRRITVARDIDFMVSFPSDNMTDHTGIRVFGVRSNGTTR